MKDSFRWLYLLGSCVAFPIQVWSKVCNGDYHCTAPHECCIQGCCLYVPPSSYYNPTNHIENYNVINASIKYYIWLTLLALALSVGLVWWCKLRGGVRRCIRSCGWGCSCRSGCSGNSPASEPDSAGSCYYPPQYSRCGSLCRIGTQPAPPPYNEVTSKPDLYPMVIYLGADKGEGDLMVQYFKNYIVRPTRSLSAASTADSLSSSYLCNTANEANTLIPPPYSCAGSVEWSCAPTTTAQRQALLRSISSMTCLEENEITATRQPLHHSTSVQMKISNNEITNDTSNCGESTQIANTSKIRVQNCTPMSSRVKSLAAVSNYKSVPESSATFNQCHNSDRSQCSSSNTNPINHQYFNMWDYSSDNQLENSNVNNAVNIDGNFSPKSMLSRLKMSRYIKEISNDSFDENNQSFILNKYLVRDSKLQSPENQNFNENLDTSSYAEVLAYADSSQCCEGEIKKCNNDRKERDYSFSNGNCERNTSICNLNSLEENQICSFFSHSIAEGVRSDNMSSDYSIFTKNLNNFGSKEEIPRMYSTGNSITGSEISSLANLGTPDSPPQATSPTSEIRELLDKIQQLPKQSSYKCYDDDTRESVFTSDGNKPRRYFNKSRKNSLYMPLNLVPNSKTFHHTKMSPTSSTGFMRQFTKKNWISRSAPTTPCGGGLVPNILTLPQHKLAATSSKIHRVNKNSQGNADDDSPLLTGDENENTNPM